MPAQTFYSVLYVQFHPATEERLAIGLVVGSENRLTFCYSKEKLKAVKDLISPGALRLVRNAISSIAESIDRSNQEAKALFGSNPVTTFDYLASYSNNLIVFGKPRHILLEHTNELFTLLWKKYISPRLTAEPENAAKLRVLTDWAKSKLFSQPIIKQAFNLNYKIDHTLFPDMVFPVKFPFVGVNGSYVFGELIDCTLEPTVVKKKVSNLLAVHSAIAAQKQKEDVYIIIGRELDTGNTENQDIIKRLKRLSYVQVYDMDTAETSLADYVTKNQITPLVPQENT